MHQYYDLQTDDCSSHLQTDLSYNKNWNSFHMQVEYYYLILTKKNPTWRNLLNEHSAQNFVL